MPTSTAPRRAAPLAARRRERAPTVPTASVAPTPSARSASTGAPGPRRTAAAVGWWGASLIAASLAVALLVGAATYERLGRREIALPVLTAAVQQPTQDVLEEQLGRDAPTDRFVIVEDLVKLDVARADAAADPALTARHAAEARAEELYARNLPSDPGAQRTNVGVARSFLAVMSEENHGKVGKSLVAAAVLALALLAWCALHARNDNVLLLPACALGCGWLVASAAKLLVVELLTDVGPASDAFVDALGRASAAPFGIARTAAIGMLTGAAIYRVATLARLRIERRRVRKGIPVPA